MILFWAGLLAVTILLYVLLDGFDLGVGMLFAFAPSESGAPRDARGDLRRSGTATRLGWS